MGYAWNCVVCGIGRATLPEPPDPWSCCCGTPHRLCYRCVAEMGLEWTHRPGRTPLEVCPVSHEYLVTRELMADPSDSLESDLDFDAERGPLGYDWEDV